MKVSRYKWPEDKAERLAVIQANLTVEIPERRWGKQRAQKEELEDGETENADEK